MKDEEFKKFESEETEDHFDDKEDGIEPEEDDYDEDDVMLEDETNEPYSTKDLALGVVDLLNSAEMDYDTGMYDELDDAMERLGNLQIANDISDDDWDAIWEDGDYYILQDFIEKHPNEAEKIFNAIAKSFGYSNYVDYRTYVDWVESGGEDEYLNSIGAFDTDSELDEATNTGAIVNTPGKHILLDLDEDEDENEGGE